MDTNTAKFRESLKLFFRVWLAITLVCMLGSALLDLIGYLLSDWGRLLICASAGVVGGVLVWIAFMTDRPEQTGVKVDTGIRAPKIGT